MNSLVDEKYGRSPVAPPPYETPVLIPGHIPIGIPSPVPDLPARPPPKFGFIFLTLFFTVFTISAGSGCIQGIMDGAPMIFPLVSGGFVLFGLALLASVLKYVRNTYTVFYCVQNRV